MAHSPTEAAAAAIRAELGRQRRSGRDLGRELGWSPTGTHRRLSGQQALTLNELYAVAVALRVTPSHLMGDEAA